MRNIVQFRKASIGDGWASKNSTTHHIIFDALFDVQMRAVVIAGPCNLWSLHQNCDDACHHSQVSQQTENLTDRGDVHNSAKNVIPAPVTGQSPISRPSVNGAGNLYFTGMELDHFL